MKDLGMGKSGMEPIIMEEATKLIVVLSKKLGTTTSLKLQLNISILNAMWHILTGETLEYDDPRCKTIIEKFSVMISFLFPAHLKKELSSIINLSLSFISSMYYASKRFSKYVS